MIEIKNLTKQYDTSVPLKDVSVTINDGDVISIIGPSGTGKSTFIRMLIMLDKPTSGEIYLDGVCITNSKRSITEARKKIGMVFQEFNLFENHTVLENVVIPQMDLLKKSREEATEKAIGILRKVGLAAKLDFYPDELSGGQKQRAAIARTVAMDPEVILFDEPTSALDPTMVGEVQAVIRDLAKMGKTMLIVTHEMQFARDISTRVFYMDDSGIYEDGTPEQVFDNPQGELTKRFMHKYKTFEADIEGIDADLIEIMNNLGNYCNNNQIPKATFNHINSIVDELCHEIILGNNPDTFINFSVEYDSDNGYANISVKYSGESFNPLQSDNIISLRILKNYSTDFKFSRDESEPLPNNVSLKVQ